MKIKINGFEEPIEFSGDKVCIVEILDRRYAGRVAASLLSKAGEEAIEPYVIWGDDEKLLEPSNVYMAVESVFALPWNNRSIINAQLAKIDALILESNSLRNKIDALAYELRREIFNASLQLGAEYDFISGWDTVKYLKAFGFGIESDSDASLFENMRKFLLMLGDIGFQKALVFAGFKQFFVSEELENLYDLQISLKIPLLSIESVADNAFYYQEDKITIDKHFLKI